MKGFVSETTYHVDLCGCRKHEGTRVARPPWVVGHHPAEATRESRKQMYRRSRKLTSYRGVSSEERPIAILSQQKCTNHRRWLA